MRTLEQHLAEGYDYLIRGVRGDDKWKPDDLVQDIANDESLHSAVVAKVAALAPVVAIGPERCFVSFTQNRILTDAIRALDAL